MSDASPKAIAGRYPATHDDERSTLSGTDAGTLAVLRNRYPHVRGTGGQHHRAHFHAFYQEHAAVFTVDTLECLSGSLPKPQQRLVEAWAEIHRAELQHD